MGFFFLVFYLIPLIVAMWVFFDSQKHGYTFWQGLLWAIGVFFVLIVFLPLYFVYRNKRRKTVPVQVRAQTPASGTPCFYCGQLYQGNPKTCPTCGQNLKIQ
jgi:membrane protease YdiL (CAAX protease family)